MVLFVVCAALTVGLISVLPANADIGACPSIEPPRTEAEAIDRAALAFDGVVVEGRVLTGLPNGRLVSPLVFRVTRVIKGNLSHYEAPQSASGDALLTVWDAGYWRPALRRKVESGGRVRVPGEIKSTAGRAWRIYVLNEAGINFTSTTCLGSHVLAKPVLATDKGLGWFTLTLLAAVAASTLAIGGWLIERKRWLRRV